ncbi:DNA-binding protein [Hydrogenophaga sp. RWCD_12]|uniref:DNA-binding protein n=1 Tax=Hydrogenophaga sp. RWCD_12 TaxID=3391190 RepID=UPI003984B05D
MKTSHLTLAEKLREPGTTRLSVPAFCKLLGLQEQDLAEVAGVDVETLRTHPESVQLQGALRNLLRLLSVAVTVEPDLLRSATFIKGHPISTFSNKTLMQLVKEGRTDDAVGYLGSISAGHLG